MNIDSIIEKISKNAPRADIKKIRQAYLFAESKHKNQLRKSGDKYIIHPLFVTDFLSQFNFNTATYVAALLHDVVEDTETDFKIIKDKFGDEAALLIKGVTKLKNIKGKLITNESLKEYSVENLQKMFLAMGADIRVILIKLADRLHNMKTLEHLDSKDRVRIAKETIEIYAPLANRLGMGEMRGQLEDYSFPFIHPEEYKKIKELYAQEIERRKHYIDKAQAEISSKLKENKIEYLDIHGRTKHLYSLYKKLKRHDNNIKKIYDLIATRVIVKDIADCYKVLGMIHQMWKPLIGRIKDYISLPKANGYQSLHTTVLTSDGEIVEIQIRTKKMHEEAEYGIAAHWYYTETGKSKTGIKAPEDKTTWIKQLIKWQKEVATKETGENFMQSLKIDIFKDRIFAFTPKGKIIDLPDGATPIDFAYQIHSDIGNYCQGAKVNDKIVQLNYKLENGDRVEILTSKNATPNRDWLNFTNTSYAKNQIKSFYRHQDRSKNIELGKEFLNEKLRDYNGKTIDSIPKAKVGALLKKMNFSNLDDLLIQIALGEIRARSVIKNLYKESEIFKPLKKKPIIPFGKPQEKRMAIIEGESGFLTNIAKCCDPKIGDTIKAYITRSKGASIHKSDCAELIKNKDGRIATASWHEPYKGTARLAIETLNRVGMLRDLTDIISENYINIKDVKTSDNPKKDTVSIHLSLELKNLDQLFNILSEIKNVEGVISVKKILK